ncbi:zinc finger protein 185 [Cololabis saira]|uniref:zinc finger protein 185 n=1 Tax=Cololabis saira TaxID=129043 RepID=UPI002AD44FBD|nr:zinc finger protein 185 [Cololabis saira]XP_061581047.1 zinc finger protein 185 [Cololabis saira]
MSKEGDRASVFRTTKVRTKLKGDGSWMQRKEEPQAEAQEEKPWVAAVRARRLNGAPIETSPVSSPTKSTPEPTKLDNESRAPTSGYLIRGIFTKLEKPAPTPASNGISPTTQITKKPSETYKRIAPHTVRPTSEQQEGQLSPEEQEKRTEAARNVLKRNAAKQRSYVLSAAKKYEAKETSPDTSLIDSSPSFVAKRVEISDDDDDESSASTGPPSPVVPVTSATPAPEPKPRKTAVNTVKTPADLPVNEPEPEQLLKVTDEPPNVTDGPPKVEAARQEPVKEVPLPQSVIEKGQLEDMKSVSTEQHNEDSSISEQAETSQAKLLPPSHPPPSPESPAPGSAIPESPVPASRPTSSSVPASPAPVTSAPVSLIPVSAVTEATVKLEPESEPEPEPESEPETQSKMSQEISSSVDTLSALSDTLISFDTSSSSFNNDQPELAKEEGGSADRHAAEDSVEQGPDPLSNGEPITDDLLGFSDGPQESAEPVPPSPGRWSQDLLSALDSESNQAKTDDPQEVLTNDPTVTNTDINSQEDNADPWSLHATTTVTETSSTDPFDPYPIGTTSRNSSSDLLQPLSDISINSMSSNALESLADNVIPIDTDTKSLSSRRSWTRTWDASPPEQTNTEESPDAEPEAEGQAEDQQTGGMFERKSTENESPWKRWTSPPVYPVTATTEEEENEKEDDEEKEEREIESEPEPAMDRSVTHTPTVVEEEQRVQTPEPEPKKGFVYVKEYVNATELSLHNPRETDGGADYLTSSSVGYSYSPSSYSRAPQSSTCTYCGEQVGNDAKISIEHLNINCHPACFKCDLCSKPMGDLLSSMFLHGGKVHCESCYASV